MTNIGDAGNTIRTLLDPDQPDALHAMVIAAAHRSAEIEQQLDAALEGSTNELADELRNQINAITQDLGALATRLIGMQATSEQLLQEWGIGGQGTTEAVPAQATATPPAFEYVHYVEPPGEGPLFDPDVNLFDPRIQRRLDTPLHRLFSPGAVGKRASDRILTHLESRGQLTVRDALSSGHAAVFGSLGKEYCEIIQAELTRVCPEIPIAPSMRPADLARFHESIHTVPLQALIPEYRHSTNKKVTVGDLVDPETGKFKSYPPARFHARAGTWERIREFITDFENARRQP